jgi:hypothetical protein
MKKLLTYLLIGVMIMITTSADYKTAISASSRESRITGTLTLTDNTVISITDADIVKDSLYIDEAIVPGDDFAIGSANAAECGVKLRLPNDNVDGAELKLSYGIKNELITGQEYGGGILAYILQPGDIGYDADRVKGLILSETASAAHFSSVDDALLGTTSSDFGEGANNTAELVAQGDASAAQYAASTSTEGGYSDWYIPSVDEWAAIYSNKSKITTITTEYLWTSTEIDADNAYGFSFDTGVAGSAPKNYNYYYRSIRSFEIPVWEEVPLGTYTVNEPNRGINYIDIVAFDNMISYDKFVDESDSPDAPIPLEYYIDRAPNIGFHTPKLYTSNGEWIVINGFSQASEYDSLADISVLLTTNTIDTLDVLYSDINRTLTIKLANVTASKNTDQKIYDAIFALGTVGTLDSDMKRFMYFSEVTVSADWNSTAIESAETEYKKCEEMPITELSTLSNLTIEESRPDGTGYNKRNSIFEVAIFTATNARVTRYNRMEFVKPYKAGIDRTIAKNERIGRTKVNDGKVKITKVILPVQDRIFASGTDGQVLELPNMEFFFQLSNSALQTACDNILSEVTQSEYVPFEFDFIGDPSLQPGDWITIEDTNDLSANVDTMITHSTWRYRGKHTLRGVGNTKPTLTPLSKPQQSVDNLRNTLIPATFTDATYENSWVSFGSPHYDAGYRLAGKTVTLRGVVKNGTVGASIFTLPSNMRPTKSLVMVVLSNSAIGRVTIVSNGTVVVSSGNNAWVSLDGISFELD